MGELDDDAGDVEAVGDGEDDAEVDAAVERKVKVLAP